MYIYVYIYIYTCVICMCKYIYLCVCTYIHAYVHTYIYKHTPTQVHAEAQRLANSRHEAKRKQLSFVSTMTPKRGSQHNHSLHDSLSTLHEMSFESTWDSPKRRSLLSSRGSGHGHGHGHGHSHGHGHVTPSTACTGKSHAPLGLEDDQWEEQVCMYVCIYVCS